MGIIKIEPRHLHWGIPLLRPAAVACSSSLVVSRAVPGLAGSVDMAHGLAKTRGVSSWQAGL